VAVQFATKEENLLAREYPFRHRLRRCHLPQGDGFSGGGKVSDIAIRRPLEGRLPPLRGKMSRSDKRGNLANVVSLRG